MKIELTERDKKLLTFMGVFVIVVVIGYYFIIPQLKKASEYKDEIEEQEILQDVNQQKVMALSDVELNNSELEKLIDNAKDNYFPVMDSDEVDNLVTNTVIDQYGLKAYDLSIGEKTPAGLQPYIYSEKALTGKSDAKERALRSAAPVISDDGMSLFGDIAEAETETNVEEMSSVGTTGIYMVTVQMRLSGDMKNIMQLLDDLALSEKKLRLVDYFVSTQEITIPHEDGTEEKFYTESLDITVELYMCQD